MGAGVLVQGAFRAIAFPVLTILVLLEPLVRFATGALALLLLLAALFLKAVASGEIPFWEMIGASVGCVALLVLYEGLIRALS
jgi:hypothetical protein